MVAIRSQIWQRAIDGHLTREKEILLLGSRHTLADEKSARIRECTSTPFDSDFVIRKSLRHGTIRSLTRNLLAFGGEGLSEMTRRRLVAADLLLSHRQRSLVQDLIRVLSALQAKDIPAIVFKGPALSILGYGDSFERRSSDVDVLVEKTRFLDAAEVVESSGYRSTVPNHALAQTIERKNGVTFLGKNGSVDLHWTLDDFPFRARLGNVWTDVINIEVGGFEIKTLPLDKLFVFLSFHGFKHGWSRLGWIIDIVQLSGRRDLDLSGVLAWSKSVKMDRIVQVSLILADALGGAALNEQVRGRIYSSAKACALARSVSAWLLDGPRPLEVHRFRVRCQQRWSDKCRFAVHRARRSLGHLLRAEGPDS